MAWRAYLRAPHGMRCHLTIDWALSGVSCFVFAFLLLEFDHTQRILSPKLWTCSTYKLAQGPISLPAPQRSSLWWLSMPRSAWPLGRAFMKMLMGMDPSGCSLLSYRLISVLVTMRASLDSMITRRYSPQSFVLGPSRAMPACPRERCELMDQHDATWHSRTNSTQYVGQSSDPQDGAHILQKSMDSVARHIRPSPGTYDPAGMPEVALLARLQRWVRALVWRCVLVLLGRADLRAMQLFTCPCVGNRTPPISEDGKGYPARTVSSQSVLRRLCQDLVNSAWYLPFSGGPCAIQRTLGS